MGWAASGGSAFDLKDEEAEDEGVSATVGSMESRFMKDFQVRVRVCACVITAYTSICSTHLHENLCLLAFVCVCACARAREMGRV